MRLTLLFLIGVAVIMSTSATAQITINNNLQPPPGTTFEFRGDALIDSAFYASITSGSGGPMQWDFSSRTYNVGYVLNVVSTLSTPSIDSFPNANLVFFTVIAGDSIWTIQRSDPNVFTEMGSVSHSSFGQDIIVYRNNLPDWVFPISDGNQWTGLHRSTQNASPFHTEIVDSTVYTADAWGTIIYRTNSETCLRVMSHEIITSNTYDSLGHLIYSNVGDNFTANFVADGFSLPIALTKSVSGDVTFYSSYALSDFVAGPSDVSENGNLPNNFELSQNYPNPFNAATTIQYDIPRASDVTVDIFDVLGRKVDILINGRQEAGSHRAIWNAASVSSGIYFYRIQAGSFGETKKMLLLK